MDSARVNGVNDGPVGGKGGPGAGGDRVPVWEGRKSLQWSCDGGRVHRHTFVSGFVGVS